LNRRRALSIDSPSCNRTSAKSWPPNSYCTSSLRHLDWTSFSCSPPARN